jgi:hypothetical protein
MMKLTAPGLRALTLAIVTLLTSCVAPPLARKSDRATLRAGPASMALMLTSKPLARDPVGSGANKLNELLMSDSNLFKAEIYAQPGLQDLIFCIRASYSTGLGTVIKNDKFAHLRADLKAGHEYELLVHSERDTTKSIWWSPQDELRLVTYELIDKDTRQGLGRVPGKLLNKPEDLVEFFKRSGMIGAMVANKGVKR